MSVKCFVLCFCFALAVQVNCKKDQEPAKPDDFICPEPDGVFPDRSNCSNFFVCFSNFSYPLECPEDMIYSVQEQRCDLLKNVALNETDCILSVKEEEHFFPTTTIAPFACRSVDGLFMDPENCSNFIQCDNAQPVYHECPENLVFNPNKSVCDWLYNYQPTNCTLTPGIQNSYDSILNGTSLQLNDFSCPNLTGIHPNTADCNTFYVCSNGLPYQLNCPAYLVFNPETLHCDWLLNVNTTGCKIPKKIKDIYGIVDETEAPQDVTTVVLTEDVVDGTETATPAAAANSTKAADVSTTAIEAETEPDD